MSKIFLLTAVLLFLFTACNGSGDAHETGGTPSTLYMAILIDDGNLELENLYEDFRLALQEYIGIPVTLVPGLTHLVGIESMRAGNLHLM